MEAKCHKNHIYTEPACKRNDYISRSCGILRLIGRYKVAFLFFLTRLILISCVVPRFSECIRTDRINSQFLSKIKTENVNSCNICKIVDSPLESFGKHSRYKMSKLSRLKPYCAISRLKRLNRNYLFVNNIKAQDSLSNTSKINELENLSKIKLNRILKAYEPQGQNYGSTYQSSYTVGPQSYGPSYGPGYAQSPGPREDFYTFVSSHYRNMGEDIVEYLNRKKIEYTESPLKYTLKFCPFCPPHRFKSDNLFKHEIFKNSGNSYCHRCGYKGSLFDFKAHMGDLPGAFDLASDPISSPFGQKKMPKDPEVTIEDVNKFEDNLYNNQEYRVVYEYLTKTRGIKPQVLRKYHVGAGTFKFKSMTGKLEQEKCVVFPWLMSPNTRSSVIGGDIENMTGQSEDQSGSEVFDYNQAGSEKLIVNRIKVRSIYDKGKMKILPRGGTWGMFGGHLIKEALEKDSIVLSEGEFDAMSIFQETGRVAASLPNGANSLPLALLPKLEKFNQIYLWMDFDAAGQSSISHFANKLGIQRVKVVHPINTPATTQATGAAGLDKTQGSKGKTKSAVEKGVKGKGQVSTGGGNSADGTAAEGSTGAFITKSMKDANEVMLSRSVDMETYFKNATVLSHSQILSFNDIRQLVYNELSDPISTCGIKSITMPGLSNLLKGHRRGELTVWTGSTGSGKTTLLSQLSLDYCLQGVSTLWGSFEINNVRLAKTMLRQFSGRNLENNLNEFDYYANKFNELPLRFLKFHGSTNIDIVLDAMDYAVYVHDVQHIIIDNLQFMLSNYSTPSATSGHGGSGYSSVKDVYELQNRTIEKFRRFVTNKNVHLSLVVHPRKEADGIQLGLSSVFGSVKSTQEADNVIILQNILNESRCIDVKKNRFAGLLGRVYFKFDPVSLTAQEFKVTEYLNEYITNGGSGGGMSKVSKAKAGGKEQSKSELGAKGNYEYRDKVILSNYKVGPGATSPPNKEFPTNLNAVPANNTSSGSSANVGTVVTGSNKGTSTPRMNATGSPTYTQTASAGSPSTYTTTSSAGSASQATSSYRPFVATTMNSTSSSGSPYNNYRERERNNIGLVGIDLLNLSPVSQQINKIIQSNYSTSSGTSADAGNGTAMELSGDDNKLSNSGDATIGSDNKVHSVNNNDNTAGSNTNSLNSSLNNNNINSLNNNNNNNNVVNGVSSVTDEANEPQGDGKKKRGRKGIKEGTADGEELGDCLRMRGITINKNSSIKEMREFVKKNGLGELVKTAGKGLKKDTIYENIKAIIPKSAIITGGTSGLGVGDAPSGVTTPTEASASPSDYGGQYEGTEVDGMKEGAPGEEVYPFGISTSESLMRKEHQRVMASTEVEQFKLKYLTKLPKSLYPEKDQKRVTSEERNQERKLVLKGEEKEGGVVLGNELREHKEEEDLGVETDVYYSASYDPLLMDGVIYVDDWKKLESMEPLFRRVKLVGVDIETTGLDYNNNKIRLIQISSPNQPTVILDLFKIRNNTVASGPGTDASSADTAMGADGTVSATGTYTNDTGIDGASSNSNADTTANTGLEQSTVNIGASQEVDDEHVMLRCNWLKDIFKSAEVTKVFHNGKFDINFLRVYGFEFGGKIFDTMIASKILVASRYISCKLTHVSERYLNIVLDKTQQYSDWSTLQLFEEQLLYSARDAFVLLPLYVILEHLLKINKLSDIAEVENKCILATSDMELNGIEVDKRKLEALQNELMEEHTQISDKMHQQLEEEDINLNSQKQLLEKLQELRIMDKSRRKLISDTSEATLIRNASNPIIATLREYRKANKALTAFTQKLPNHINEQTNRIYPNYNQLGAESGRFSCDGPNLQQVPREKKFRECFVASKGNKFVIADFSQIELRIAAEIANDAKMIQAYQEHVDLHSLTASILKSKSIEEVTKEERQLAKAVNFGLIFGMSVNGLRMYAETGYKVKLSQQESKEIYTSFFNNFKGILNWHNSVKNSKPTMVRTLGNRLSVFDSFSFTRSLNYPVQGTSADITKETMARLVDLVKPLDAKIIICIHDEIILEVPERNAQKALDMLIDTMVKSGEKYLKKVPVEAMGSIGDSWADKE